MPAVIVCKLSDFGLSRRLRSGEDHYEFKTTWDTVSDRFGSTYLYMYARRVCVCVCV